MPFSIFISYRHGDTDGIALLLHDRLSNGFGADNVFLDVKSLGLGTRWLRDIKSHGSGGGAVLALIGPNWLPMLKQREHREAGTVDFVQMELELALTRWGGHVIPVLVGGAVMPEPVNLPRPLRPLAALQGVGLRHEAFDDDLERLLAALHQTERAASTGNPDEAVDAGGGPAQTPSPLGVVDAAEDEEPGGRAPQAEDPAGGSAERASIREPDDGHYRAVLDYMVDSGNVVPVLGPRLRGALPDADALAGHLAERFKLASRSTSLARVAQEVSMLEGPSSLARELREALRGEREPTTLQRFLAALPGRLAERGLPARYQMIVSTGYDVGLEQAFEDAAEPYDLAVFIPGGADKGRFMHVPWQGEPVVIPKPSLYRGFPIDGYDDLERSIIVKVLGEPSGTSGTLPRDRGLVVTEDQYIDYLVTEQIGSVIPLQILNKLTSSHCLFLGYRMGDWSLRVFLRRIWHGGPLEDRSWAVEENPDELEKDFWSAVHVELLASTPDRYAERLDELVAALSATGAQ
jgi:SIR2-like domain/TIR domain